MVHASRFIILNVTRTGERSLVLHTLSPVWGRRSFIVTAGKGASMALFLPLSVIDAEVVENSKSDLWRMRSIAAAHPLCGLRGNVAKNAITMFMSEVLYRTIRDGACEDGLFEWCERGILTLDALPSDFANYHLRWLLELCGALGFAPSLEDLMPFAGDRLAELRELLRLDFAGCMMLPLSGRVRNEIADILLQYLGYHCDCRIDCRSLGVLGEVFR